MNMIRNLNTSMHGSQNNYLHSLLNCLTETVPSPYFTCYQNERDSYYSYKLTQYSNPLLTEAVPSPYLHTIKMSAILITLTN